MPDRRPDEQRSHATRDHGGCAAMSRIRRKTSSWKAQRQGPSRVDADELLAERTDDAFCHRGQIPLYGRRQPSQQLERSSGHVPASWQRCAASVRVRAASGSAPARPAFFASNPRVHSPAAPCRADLLIGAGSPGRFLVGPQEVLRLGNGGHLTVSAGARPSVPGLAWARD